MLIKYPVLKDSNIRDYLLSFYASKSYIYKIFFEKRVYVSNIKVNEAYNVKKGDIIYIDEEVEVKYKPLDKKLDILYEDDHILIINKPKNIIIHDDTNSLCNMVAAYYKKKNLDLNIYFAHRLDYDTTGVILFCKDHITLSYFDHFFETHEFKREYRLLVNGILLKKEGQINKPIAKNRHVNGKYLVYKTGKNAITNYKVLKEYDKYSYLSILLKTGRTHQIRVHMSYLSHPLLGDKLYGDTSNICNRVMLHSYKITFINPWNGKEESLVAKLPDDFNALL